MTADRQTEKLKERLHQWQSYAAQASESASVCLQEADSARPDRQDAEVLQQPAILPALAADAFEAQSGNRDRPNGSGEHYEEQLARLEAELETERAHAQELAVKWGSEVLRRRRETQNQKSRRYSNTRPLIIEAPVSAQRRVESAPMPQPSQRSARNYWPLIVVCASALLAGVCSFIALHLDWSLGR